MVTPDETAPLTVPDMLNEEEELPPPPLSPPPPPQPTRIVTIEKTEIDRMILK
jgi:hypothetical protein